MLIDAQLLCEGEKKMGCGAGKWAAVSNHTQRPSVASTSSAVSGASSEGGRVEFTLWAGIHVYDLPTSAHFLEVLEIVRASTVSDRRADQTDLIGRRGGRW